MAVRRLPRELVACGLIAVFGANAVAQSLADLAREQRQKKASAPQSNAAKQKVFSNVDDPRPQAITPSGQTARDATQRPDMPAFLSELNSPSLIVEAQGQTYPLLILAHFTDGSVLDTRDSGRVTFHSTDTKIVTVDATGTAMAVATGTASIIVSYRNPSGPDLQLKIPVTVLRFQLSFAPPSLDFGQVHLGSSVRLSVAVTNNSYSDMSLMIKAVTATLPYSATDNCISSSPLAVGATCEITVTFTPAATGQSPGTLTIPNSSSGVPSVILMSGVGVK
jgi:hypothetical protein